MTNPDLPEWPPVVEGNPMTINSPDVLVGFEAVSLPYGQDVYTHQLIVQRAPNLADDPIYAVTVDNSPLHFISSRDAARLVKQLARDLYEAGHITPGEITDHMLRDTATRTEEEGED